MSDLLGMPAVVLFLLIAVAVWVVFRPRGGAPAEAIKPWLDRGAVVIDVRSPAEFAGGHVDGARNIPVDEVGLRLHDIGTTDVPVIVYCASGMRSRRAAGILEKAGYDVLDAGTARSFP
jgi:rhodanese-related sulfurtransferase